MDEAETFMDNAKEILGLEKSLKPDLDNYGAAKILKHTGKYRKAIKSFIKIFNTECTEGSKVMVCIQIGDCYLRLKEYDEAIKWYEQADLLSPANQDIYILDKIYYIRECLEKKIQ